MPKAPYTKITVNDRKYLAKRFVVPYNYELDKFKTSIVGNYKDFIHSVYMAPPSGLMSSARTPHKVIDLPMIRESVRYFASEGIESYLAINGGWNAPTTYTSQNFSLIASVLKDLEVCGLTGVIIGSSYLANAGFIQKVCPSLKVMPTVNNGFDTFDRASIATDLVKYDGIIWDRNINPEIDKLKEYNKKYKEMYPNKTTAILLNEGCLRYCPFKKDHDQILAMVSFSDPEYYAYLESITKVYPDVIKTNGSINTLFGCKKAMRENPKLIDDIPYIDPCDLDKYVDCADLFKLSGRTHHTIWIASLLNHYVTATEKLPRSLLDSGLGGESTCQNMTMEQEAEARQIL